MTDNLAHILNQLPVQAKFEAREEGSPWEFISIYTQIYTGLATIFCQKVRIEFEKRLTASGETVAHGAFILLSAGTSVVEYLVDLRAKTYKVRESEDQIGFDLASMFPGLKLIEVVHEDPDPHLFLIPADLKPD